jgi:hypothetical protein
MNETNMNEAAKNLSRSVYETNQTIARSAVAAQERNMRFAQSIFDNGIEILKEHAEATQNLMRAMTNQSQNPQTALQEVMESTKAAQERNVKFAQNVAVNGTEVFKSHIEATRTLMQDVAEKTHEQQELLLTLPYVDAYMEMFRAPLANYKQAVEATQALTKQAMEMAQQSAQKGMEVAQNIAHQTMDATLSATRHNQQ